MKLIIYILYFFYSLHLFSQQPTHQVYLVGDAGENTYSGDALMMLKDDIANNLNSTVIFLGDNVYPAGLDLKDENTALRLKSQLHVLNNYKGNVFFIPGNHDWAAQKSDGMKRITEQQKFISNYLRDSSSVLNKNENTFLPQNALPGPQSVVVATGLRIIFVDTQWFLHFHKKNKQGSIKKTKEKFYYDLDSILNLSKNNNQQVIVAGHHPIYTNGNHSSKRQPVRFLINYTPLKIFGWMGLDRAFSQDIDSRRYKKMRKEFIEIFDKHGNIIYVSGHDHNIQYFTEKNNKYIVSGSGSKLTPLKKKKRFESIYQSDDKTGYVKLQFEKNNLFKIEVKRVGEKSFEIGK